VSCQREGSYYPSLAPHEKGRRGGWLLLGTGGRRKKGESKRCTEGVPSNNCNGGEYLVQFGGLRSKREKTVGNAWGMRTQYGEIRLAKMKKGKKKTKKAPLHETPDFPSHERGKSQGGVYKNREIWPGLFKKCIVKTCCKPHLGLNYVANLPIGKKSGGTFPEHGTRKSNIGHILMLGGKCRSQKKETG